MRGMLLMIRAGRQASRQICWQASRHCELRSSYLLRVCRSYGAWEDVGIEMDYWYGIYKLLRNRC